MRTRARTREGPHKPVTPRPRSRRSRPDSKPRPRLFAPVRAPNAPFFAQVTRLSPEKNRHFPRPGVVFASVTPVFRPGCPGTDRPGHSPGVVFCPGDPGFRPGFPRHSPGDPGFAPADPAPAHAPASPTAPVSPAPAHRDPGFPPRSAPASPRPATLPRFAVGKWLCAPRGASNPGALRLETAAQARVNFREIGGPGVWPAPGHTKRRPEGRRGGTHEHGNDH